MTQPDSAIGEIEDSWVRLTTRVDDLLSFLAYSRSNLPADSTWQSGPRDARALAIVCTIAELESLTKTLIQETHKALNSLALPISRLLPCLRQIAVHTTFESLRDAADSAKIWENRGYATTLDLCNDSAIFPITIKTAQPPLDGRTLRPDHFRRMWSIYGLSGVAFADPKWPGSLLKLSNARNELAHGTVAFPEVFQQAGRSIDDIEGYIRDISDFALHLVTFWCEHLREQRYVIAA